MKISFLFLIVFLLSACLNWADDLFDKDYYEKTTKINFPDNYTTLATVDNGEFLTLTILKLSKSDCISFINKYNFSPVRTHKLELIGLNWLDKKYQNLPGKNMLVKEKWFDNGIGWIYLMDTSSFKLYCQINYPDKEE
jgi:hypothetical protein